MAIENFKDLIKQLKLKRFRYRCGIDKNSTQQDVETSIINYANNIKFYNIKVKEIELTDEQLSDCTFMQKLYLANKNIITEPKFMPSGENAIDDDYMVWYFKNVAKYVPLKLNETALKYGYLFENDDFLIQFSKKIPEANLFKILDVVNVDKNYDRIQNLPVGVLLEQSRNHGNKALKYIPTNHKYFRNFVDAGILYDGFESLMCLPLDKVVANKKLVIKAYAMSGFDALDTYLRDTLNPSQTEVYSFKDKKYIKREYSRERNAVQKALLQDPEIKQILEREKLKQSDEMKK